MKGSIIARKNSVCLRQAGSFSFPACQNLVQNQGNDAGGHRRFFSVVPSVALIMLSREEHWLNIWAIKYLSHTRVIPVKINTGTGKIRVLKDVRALLAWSAYFAAVQFHSFYAVYNGAKFLGQGLKAMKGELPYHYCKIFIPQVATLLAISSFLIQPQVFAALFNSSIGAMDNEQPYNKRRRTRAKAKRRFLNLSYNEMLTVLLPFASFPTGLLILVGVTVMDFWPFTLDKLLTVSSVLKILADTVAIFGWISWAYFGLHFQFLFLEKVNYSLKQEIVHIR